MRQLSPLARACAAGTGAQAGIALGVLAADGRVVAIGAAFALAAALAATARAMVPETDRRSVGAILALSFALHLAVATLLYTGSLANGGGGFITGDDREYGSLSRAFVLFSKGEPDPFMSPPNWAGEAYLFGTWVYLESAIFYVLGYEPLVPIFLNGLLALVVALLASDIARRLFDRRAGMVALVLAAFFPSLVIWTSLNLKEGVVLFLMATVVWSLVLFRSAHRWWTLALAFAPLIALESLRLYIFVGLALLIPMAVVLSPGISRALRARWTVVAIAASALFLSLGQTGVGLGPRLIADLEVTRSYMGVGARTRFVDSPPRQVSQGDTFVIAAPPTPSPTTVHVPPNAILVVATPSPLPTPPPSIAATATRTPVPTPTATPTPTSPPSPTPVSPTGTPARTSTPSPTVVVVRPGDLVVVGGSTTTPAPSGERKVISPTSSPIQLTPGSPSPGPSRSSSPVVTEGTTFVVATPAASVVHVSPDARIVVATGTPGPTPTDPSVVLVRPGDVVVVGGPATTPAPEYLRRYIAASAPPVQLRSGETPTEVIALRTLAHLPTGLAHSLFAPFPWQVSRAVDIATIPDVLIWYVVLVCAAVSVLRDRARWRVLFPLAGLAIGLLLLLSLVEGNVGTLYRHRAMATPWVLILAAPTLGAAIARIRDELDARRRPRPASP